MPLLLEVVTPDARVYEAQVDGVVLPTTGGEVGVLPGHIPLMTDLTLGELRVQRGAKTEAIAVDQGFVQVLGDRVSVLTEGAFELDRLSVKDAEDARARAQKALDDAKAAGGDPAEIEQLERMVQLSLMAKLTKEKRR